MKKILILLLILAGCAQPKQWTHTSNNAAQFDVDRHLCLNASRRDFARVMPYSQSDSFIDSAQYKVCMNEHGWYQLHVGVDF